MVSPEKALPLSERLPQRKLCSGLCSRDSVTALLGKVGWQSGAKEYSQVRQHSLPHTRDLVGGKNPGAAFAWATCVVFYKKIRREGICLVDVQSVVGDGGVS